jgi:hypothetical protein
MSPNACLNWAMVLYTDCDVTMQLLHPDDALAMLHEIDQQSHGSWL